MGIINLASGFQVQVQPSLLLGSLVGTGPLKGNYPSLWKSSSTHLKVRVLLKKHWLQFSHSEWLSVDRMSQRPHSVSSSSLPILCLAWLLGPDHGVWLQVCQSHQTVLPTPHSVPCELARVLLCGAASLTCLSPVPPSSCSVSCEINRPHRRGTVTLCTTWGRQLLKAERFFLALVSGALQFSTSHQKFLNYLRSDLYQPWCPSFGTI